MSKLVDMTGWRFDRLIVIQKAGKTSYGQIRWECRCDYGKTTIVTAGALREGDTKSCGCRRPRRPAPPQRLGRLLYGYKWAEDRIAIDEREADDIRQIDLLTRAGTTLTGIARTMTAMSPRADGKPWSIDTIARVVGNRHLYRGGRRGKHAATWPPILAAGEQPIDA